MEHKPSRIWELDALRGFSILAVIAIHFLYDLQLFFGLSVLTGPFGSFLKQYGGVVFIVLSGICITLGHRSLRRGLIVFSCGMLISLVTTALASLGFSGKEVLIRFGILHLLGLCMLLWPLFRRLPTGILTCLGFLFVGLGLWFSSLTVDIPWLFPLGLHSAGFYSADYFPLFPHLGWFLLGAVAGRCLYRDRQSLFPGAVQQLLPIRFLCSCGRNSLWMYLLHQPALFILLSLH